MPETSYNLEIANEICLRISSGETLSDILRSPNRPDLPAYRTVCDWRHTFPEFETAYQRARDLGHDALAERTRRTARGLGPDQGGDSTGDVARDKLIIDQENKLLSKWSPRYADKLVHAGDREQPLTVVVRKFTDA